jgi:PDZ domain-containing protein
MITVDGIPSYPTTGRLDLTIVSGTAADARLTLPEALLAYWLPGRDTLPRDAVYSPNKTADQVRAEETQMMETAQDDAVVAALRAAEQPVSEMPAVASVTVGGPAYQRLQPGDLIETVDGVAAPDAASVGRQIRSHEPGERVRFVVLRNRERVEVTVDSVESASQPDTAVVGITVGRGYRYQPRIRFDLGQRLGGPSAGLVFALAIYDKITPGDLLGGQHVAGTGMIDPTGQVGSIGGVQEKVAAAEHAGAIAFLVPTANCADLAEVDPDLSVVRVATLAEAIAAVRTLATEGPDADLPRCP